MISFFCQRLMKSEGNNGFLPDWQRYNTILWYIDVSFNRTNAFVPYCPTHNAPDSLYLKIGYAINILYNSSFSGIILTLLLFAEVWIHHSPPAPPPPSTIFGGSHILREFIYSFWFFFLFYSFFVKGSFMLLFSWGMAFCYPNMGWNHCYLFGGVTCLCLLQVHLYSWDNAYNYQWISNGIKLKKKKKTILNM